MPRSEEPTVCDVFPCLVGVGGVRILFSCFIWSFVAICLLLGTGIEVFVLGLYHGSIWIISSGDHLHKIRGMHNL